MASAANDSELSALSSPVPPCGNDSQRYRDGLPQLFYGRNRLVGTGIALSLPVGVYGRVASRSGLSLKHGLEVGGGVIDRDYTGEVKVIVYNHGDCDYTVRVGDRVAQLVLERCAHFVVTEVDELCVASERADSGFGSTGV